MSIFSTEIKERFIVLKDNGYSLDEISQLLNVSMDKIERWNSALIQEPEFDLVEELERERIRGIYRGQSGREEK
ncbi:hypothetical protein [Halarsenatibacter silvermanii]|uniref:Homeodomain-like domain-containing protein n=1 Tax=Halarsenatibacter silvermanii TaxID=321763 RepID=A0A1G9KLF4_9FIRM|nr:hypothetical protein [Halarsenatibacter silvermanii]SDL50446.1 hypothetical protein SAMN04488692_10549 [Halarsenatibacter silvermanii]